MLDVINLSKEYPTPRGSLSVLAEVSLNLSRGEAAAIMGPSGSGKSTLLHILGALDTPSSGSVTLDGANPFELDEKGLAAFRNEKVGFVFQEYALFPNMTVEENLQYALEKAQANAIVQELMYVMDIEQLQNRKPDTLSGGQKQRVALARALVRKPQLLLLDEPLSALDSEMRLKLQDHILKLHKEFNLTTILVSHDFSEIFKMSDTTMMLKNGKISGQGIPSEILVNEPGSGDFQLIGEVINIEKENFAYVISVSVGNNIIKINSSEDEAIQLNVGDKVLVSLKLLNPLIKKIS